MKLRELLNNVNEVLSENMFDRIIIREPEVAGIIDNILGLSINLLNRKIISNKFISIEIWGIEFELERWEILNKSTYVSIKVNKNYTDKLDIEIEDVRTQYKEIRKQQQELKKAKNLNNVNKFKNLLSSHGLTVDQFAEINDKFEELEWEEKRILFDIV